jgi:heterodisulfide reductase subunit A
MMAEKKKSTAKKTEAKKETKREAPAKQEAKKSAVPNVTTKQEARIGVFICHCGTNIAGSMDINAVQDYAKTLPNVGYVDNYNQG